MATIEVEREHPITAPRYGLAQAQANALTKDYSVPPIPVLEIAESVGVDVLFADLGVHRDKVAGFCDFENARLYVNERDPMNRQTFTMAHELGHWVLHREFFLRHPDRYPVLPRFQRVTESDVFEKEANVFAANLLVPSRLLNPVRRNNVAMLAHVFMVSRTMMEHRLKNA